MFTPWYYLNSTFITGKKINLSFLEWKLKIHYVLFICHCCSFKSAMNILSGIKLLFELLGICSSLHLSDLLIQSYRKKHTKQQILYLAQQTVWDFEMSAQWTKTKLKRTKFVTLNKTCQQQMSLSNKCFKIAYKGNLFCLRLRFTKKGSSMASIPLATAKALWMFLPIETLD